ncbi:hypothetical protein JOC86_005021 [Bacillus pakistanensis]|uniref:DUF2521 family protein n=1 Tax=Rossellomorea pakistanensis TaxID=992288 RepID=A0ABS2NKP2_9BACI|nr:DUF2521 family protein [Bacillus pakistanensis]MBM7588404.1 hypothetical protein [Bacillus pakistanensis]
MNVITTFDAKRREKQIKHERTLLREISIKMLQESVKKHFGQMKIQGGVYMQQGFDEACYDVAIEAYLLGGKISKFGLRGEGMDQVKLRCDEEMKHLIDTLYNFWLYWSEIGVSNSIDESFYYSCEYFVENWWTEGFTNGMKRHKLRLH